MSVIVQPESQESTTVDIDALRKRATRQLLALAEEHNLLWPREIITSRSYDGERVLLTLHLDADELDAHAAWADALYLTALPDRGVLSVEPFVSRSARGTGVLPGVRAVTVLTYLYVARGLPEQGPRPGVARAELAQAAALAADAAQVLATLAEPVAVVTAALTPDDPSLPADSDDPWAGLPVAATKPDPHANCPLTAGPDVTCDRCGKTYRCGPDADYYCAVEGDHCCEPCLIGGRPLLVVPAGTELLVERPAGEEWADWDAAEINAVRSAYVAEYGPEIAAEAGGESA